jgi:hypothetical protein
MIRKKPDPKLKEFRTPEELEKEKERVRKLKKTKSESDTDAYEPHDTKDNPLLDALIWEHPERDPAKIK